MLVHCSGYLRMGSGCVFVVVVVVVVEEEEEPVAVEELGNSAVVFATAPSCTFPSQYSGR